MAMKPAGKLLSILVIFGLLVAGYFWLSGSGLLDTVKQASVSDYEFEGTTPTTSETIDKTFKIGVVTWPGYAGGQLFNKGFHANKESGFYKSYGFKVEFLVIDDFIESRNAFKSGDLDLLWCTIDSYPTEAEALAVVKPRIIFAADKSRGGDVLLGTSSIKTLNDLKGRSLAVALGTPSHTLVLWALEAAGLTTSQVELVQVSSAVDAARLFKAGQVDAAAVWAPDDKECLSVVPGSKILTSTKEAGEIIVDAFMVSDAIYRQYPKQLAQLVEGWLRGNAELNSSPQARNAAADILAFGLNVDKTYITEVMNNVRYLTYGDNKVLFGLESSPGITAEELYATMKTKYIGADLASYSTPSWNTIGTEAVLRQVNLSGSQNDPEQTKQFVKRTKEEIKDAPVLSTKSITITFPTGSAVLDANAKNILRKEFGAILRAYPTLSVKLEGNTDNTGSLTTNMKLSELRAQSVAAFLSDAYNFSNNRFVIIGNGPNKPVASNETSEGREQNRRTDLILIL